MQHLILSGPFDERIDVLLALVADGLGEGDIDLRTENAEQMLFSDASAPHKKHRFVLPKSLLERLEYLSHHQGKETWNVIFALISLWHTDGMTGLQDLGHPTVNAARLISSQLHYESHKLKAYLRLREVKTDDAVWYYGYHSCEHDVLPLVADFFKDRFRSMRWQITTKHSSLSWDLKTLTFGPGGAPPDSADDLDDLWRTFYRSTHNPDRLNTSLFKRHVPKKYWKDLPELATISSLLAEDGYGAEEQIDLDLPLENLPTLTKALHACRSCELHSFATQVIPGLGPSQAKIMIVGEQPGDQEDLGGQPFVGPAGKLLENLATEAGLNLSSCYLTNAVKHFRYEQSGKIRLHKRPGVSHIAACRRWITAEIKLVNPSLIICLGATAVRAIIGYPLKLEDYLNRIVKHPGGRSVLITIHPAAVLRADGDRAQKYAVSLREALNIASKWNELAE